MAQRLDFAVALGDRAGNVRKGDGEPAFLGRRERYGIGEAFGLHLKSVDMSLNDPRRFAARIPRYYLKG
jgi:hypothetical protein